MQTKLLNCIEQDNVYYFTKKVIEIFISLIILFLSIFVFTFLLIKNMLNKEKIFKEELFFLKKNETIKLKFFNCKSTFFQGFSLFFYVLTSKISLVGVALIKYKKDITYKVEHKPGLFSLWFVRRNSKMANFTVSLSNKEYLLNNSIANDFKIILKSLISLLYFSKYKNYSKKIRILDIDFENLKMSEIIKMIDSSIKNNTKKIVYFINADCLNKTFKDSKYKKILQNADFILPDGSGINMACNILKKSLNENVNGTDMFPFLCKLSQEKSYKIFLLGAKDGVALKMKEELLIKYPKLKIAGFHHGYFKSDKEEKELISKINISKADILFVAMGAPIQEFFVEKNKMNINANVIFAVGGLFDFYSNNIKRAPIYLREIGFEWIYRMIQEPKRMWKRYIIGNPLFLYRVFKYKESKDRTSVINSYLSNYEKPKNYNTKKYIWELSLVLKEFVKRFIDIVSSSVLLVLFTPLFLLIALIIKLTSKGNIFFIQDRVGLNGKIFQMYKFRSMVVDAEELKEKLLEQNQSKDGVIFKIVDDPRITKIGKFIRKTSIDELPQLLNVLKGQMSLVGPRPPIIEEVKQYNVDDKKRLDVKPGITCIWQVSGRSKIPFKEQVKMDKEYIKKQSLYMDFILLLKTIPAVLFQKGSC